MCLRPRNVRGMFVQCNRCLECINNKANEWSFRIALEARLHKSVSFLTLTYNDDYLPENGSLRPKDLQDFFKRLRKKTPCRFFACGEYGSKGKRPHYHAVIFGYDFPDKQFFKRDKKGNLLYRSRYLEKLWKFGFSSVMPFVPSLARYCAKYMQKKIKVDTLDNFVQPFVRMSNRPGIGVGAIDPKWLECDKIYIDGKSTRIPRLYLDKLEQDYADRVARIKDDRRSRIYYSDPVLSALYGRVPGSQWYASLQDYLRSCEDKRETFACKYGDPFSPVICNRKSKRFSNNSDDYIVRRVYDKIYNAYFDDNKVLLELELLDDDSKCPF